ncbi:MULTISPECIES: efflux transporter outer membrane subunit [Gluconobacter]|uniref:efflux transporter outer membrane subunit n=1 Tax=Gluconobacter TaxID=441 RepID=UPI001B8CA0B2|nr:MULTISPECIES: efflux transporter outer membrane subunit [Gluconobacter]MBS0993455.1 efflux transporter outer membrane subunit [Gluconobacter cerinus]MBS1020152.1 efflux transporter outer membrane subunit [Gluconobacter cerinus]MBS1032244.1 efflux transporter outer membrane subunit [Gluconobacter cerinus]MBS1069673.1 efflux transporter outer membrane subunit [Gluconobacter cerinus]MBS1071730.1 efflux transporter outer membrane subunit [Gluconobacter cerinus]
MSRKLLTLALSTCLSLTACTVGPNFKPDKIKVPDTFVEQPQSVTAAEIARTEADMKDWWAQFHDPMLNELIEAAVKGNYDLQIASQHIISERAVRRQAQAAWYPQLDAAMGGGDDRYSINVDNWPLRPGNPANRPQASVLTYGARASWEIDLFGHISRQVEERKRLVEESLENRRAILLSLLSEVASDYVTLRGIQERLAVTEHSIDVAQRSRELTEKLYTHGLGNTLAVAQAQTEEHLERSRLAPLHSQEERLIHAISILLGEMPGKLEEELDVRRPLPSVPAFPASLPSIVLANRPDIRATEAHYAADMAQVGVAVANLYPKFMIPLTFNPNASAAYQAFQMGGMAWSFMMMASLPIIHGGRYTAEIAQARAEAEASRLVYRKTVLKAFAEVEDSMGDWRHDNELVTQLEEAATDSGLARDRAQKLFSAGLTGYLNVLTTEQTALSAQDQAVVGRMARLRDAISLYTAMGAGWQGRQLTDTRLPIEVGKQNALVRAFTR